MKKYIKLALFSICFLVLEQGFAQEIKVKTEIQSKFIDITGLFGVNEPASITQFSYSKNGFGLNLYHGFSLKQFGKTIQTIITPSYNFKIDDSGKFYIKPKVEIANLEAAGGGFIRPGIHFIYKPNAHNKLNFGTWAFIDLRNEEIYQKRLNGYTFLLSYTHQDDFKQFKFVQEGRILFVDIVKQLKVSGIFTNLELHYKPLNIYLGTNAVYTFYRSDNKNELIYNIALGKQF
jgi:hypothetical protein